MDGVQLYSTFTVIFLGLLSISYIPNILAELNINTNTALMEFFQDSKNSFNTVHVLAQLNVNNQSFLCFHMEWRASEILTNKIDLVYFDPRSYTDHPSLILQHSSPIPVFTCHMKNRSNTDFFVTYMKETEFFRLAKSDHGNIQSSDPTINHVKTMVEADFSMIFFPDFLNIITSVENSVVEYFKHEDYPTEAQMIFNILDDKILNLCNIFSLEADDPLATGSNYEYETLTAPLKIHGNEIGPVPSVKCHPASRSSDTLSFNIFYYCHRIFFKTSCIDGVDNYEMVSYEN